MKFDVPFIRPVFPHPEEVSRDLQDIIEANWFTNFGPKEREFVRGIEAYLGDGLHAVTFSNATLALMAAIKVLLPAGVNERFVLVPSFTFAAGPAAIEWADYRPLFIDVESETLQPSLASARAALATYGRRISGILLCNTFGIGNPSIGEWELLAQENDLPLIIDSAAGFGSLYASGAKVGQAGLCEIFSFHATKPFAIGEGGAVVCHDAEVAIRLKAFTNFGFTAGQGATSLGLNAKLQEINAAIGLRQLTNFDEALEQRRKTLRRMREAISGDTYRFPDGLEQSSVCFASTLLPDRETRDLVLGRLREHSIEARSYYSPAVHTQPHFADAARADSLVNTSVALGKVLSIPIHQSMAEASFQAIVNVLNYEV